MDASHLPFASIQTLADTYRRREVSPVEVTQLFLTRIDTLDPALRCFITVTGETALAEARQAERHLTQDASAGPLVGIPITLKDLFHTAGVRTTAGSRILADFHPREDATVVARLRAAGAVCLGKTNLEEFAFGATSINPHYGACRNPWDLDRIAGGSSGGSAAAVAAGLCTASLGTDSGGSIRQPAALCGVVGLKPTYGRVSRHGVVPLSWSQDHVGPLARSATDAALLLQALAGHDPRDPTSSRRPVPDYLARIQARPAGPRLGWPRDFFFERVEPDVTLAVHEAAQLLVRAGVRLEEVPFAEAAHAVASGMAILFAEASAYHEEWLRIRPSDYGAPVRGRLRVGSTLLATDYIRAQQARTVLIERLEAPFDRVDALIMPTVPVVAPLQNMGTVRWPDGTEEGMRGATLRLTRPFNLLGFPAISLPCGFTAAGLPIGLQLVARPFEESTLFRLAYAYERETAWHHRRPPLAGLASSAADGQPRGG